MPNELEQQLERALRAPAVTPTDAARRAALGALAVPPRRRRGRVPLVLALGLAIMLASAVTLYASPDARQAVGIDSYTPEHAFKPGPKRLQVPAGASGIAVAAGGRMWATAHAVSVNGARATAVELSPNSVNIAVGRGRDLVAVAANGSGERVLRRTEGRVVAVSWAPNPIEIAYVVRRGTQYRLHLMEGDGDHDRLIDPSVAPVRPTWRWDNGALAYLSSDGRVVIRDLIHARATALPRGCLHPATRLAYAPTTDTLVAGGNDSVAVVTPRGPVACRSLASSISFGIPPPVSAITWLTPTTVVAFGGRDVVQLRPHGSRLQIVRRLTESRGYPVGAAALPDNRLVIALAGHRLRMIEVDANTLHLRRVLLDAPSAGGLAPVSLR
jgi:hypothetical protein